MAKEKKKTESSKEDFFKENPAICRKCEKLPTPLSNGKMLCDCGIGKADIK